MPPNPIIPAINLPTINTVPTTMNNAPPWANVHEIGIIIAGISETIGSFDNCFQNFTTCSSTMSAALSHNRKVNTSKAM